MLRDLKGVLTSKKGGKEATELLILVSDLKKVSCPTEFSVMILLLLSPGSVKAFGTVSYGNFCTQTILPQTHKFTVCPYTYLAFRVLIEIKI